MHRYLRDKILIKKLATRVKMLRLKHELTQDQLSIKSGIDSMYISKIERGLINTSISHIAAIAKAFAMEPWELLYFDNEK